MIKRVSIAVVSLLIFLTLLSPVLAQGQVQGQITVSGSAVQVDYPRTIKFSAQMRSALPIDDIRLCYEIEQVSFASTFNEAIVEFSPATSVNALYSLDLRRIGTGGMPPGTYINYWWKVKDNSGAAVETSPIRYQVNDNQHAWQELTEGKISVYYYSGGISLAQSVMSAAQQSLTRIAGFTGAVPDRTVNIYVYTSLQDFKKSTIFEPEWAGGLAFTQFSTISIVIRPNNLASDISGIPHELTHTVIYQVTANPYNSLPVWLNEGLAMYSEGALSPQFTGPLKNAIQNNTLISVQSLSDPFSALGDQAYLSYAQSFSLVDFLISQYGQENMLELLSTFRQGSDWDAALRQVYGFDMDGLSDLWKPWVTKLYMGG